MKKYLRLSANEAISHFILRDNALAPEAAADINENLNVLQNYRGKLCVSICLPTHRTRPDYNKDIITLKNLASEAVKTLRELTDKRTAKKVEDNINEARESIDFSLGREGMVVYATEDFSTVIKLPVHLQESIMIGQDFDLSPLYKSMQQIETYYVLTVSRHLIRLLECRNDQLVKEFGNGDFPFPNTEYYTTDPIKLDQDSIIDNLIKEFFNVSDKRFQKIWNEDPLPLIIMGDVKAAAYYEEQMDRKSMLIGHVHGSYDQAPVHEIIAQVMPVIEHYRGSRDAQYRKEIDEAVSAKLLTTDINDIYQAALAGDSYILFVGESYALSGTMSDGKITPAEGPEGKVRTSDLLHTVLSSVNEHGGRIIYTNDVLMDAYGGIALIKRY